MSETINPTQFTKRPTEIRSCSCSHEFQDKQYGKGKRVFNPAKGKIRCTVCNREITV